jgi:fructokinase
MIVVGGEALVDLVVRDGHVRAIPGGGPFNTAIALGRLGTPVGFCGQLARDRFGRMLERHLSESEVDLTYARRGDEPTPLALAFPTETGEAEYTFYLAGTALSGTTPETLPAFGPEVVALHLGTLALAVDPPASAFEALLERESAHRVVVIDPNARPGVMRDPARYRVRFERWTSRAQVIKLSLSDAAWLYPEVAPEDVVQRLLSFGAKLVALTLGPDGAIATTAVGSARVPAARIDVVDTIGAGDAFGAGLLHRLLELEKLDTSSIGGLDDAELDDVLTFATAVAALQCSRAGSQPPTLHEVERFLHEPPERAMDRGSERD